MTIDEFLKKTISLKEETDLLFQRYCIIEDKAENPGATNLNGTPASSTNRNYTEERYINLISAGEKWRKSNEEYQRYKKILERAIYNLLYWEGLLIEQVYIINPALKRDKYAGVYEILKTKEKRVVYFKLKTAKEHLKQILNENGIKID